MTTITAQDLYQHYGSDFRSRIDSVFTEDTDTWLSDRLRANVSRFAAYKAEYVSAALQRTLNDATTPEKDRQKYARAVLRTFSRYQDAERSTATARARTAKQFEEFLQPDNVRLFPNLKWLPSRSADPRVSHTAFYNRVWAKDDPFWNFNAPGTEWNCKCDIEETDEPLTDNTAVPQPTIPLGLEGNPAQTGEIFTDNASYIRTAGRNRAERDRAELNCENLSRPKTIQRAREALLETDTLCTINGERHTVMFIPQGIAEYSQSMKGNRTSYWLKNEILTKIKQYIETAECVGKKVSDTSHNTRPQTVRLKRNTDFYYYFKIELPNGETAYLHLGRYKQGHERAGKFYLYTITRQLPENVETP